MVKLKLHIVWLLLLSFLITVNAQDYVREMVSVPKVDSGAIKIDGVMDEAEWSTAASADIITSSGYNIWANKYYRESLVEPEFDELYAKMLWNKDTLYVFVHIDEFVNDSTGLYWNGQWAADQLFISISSRLGMEMMGWYDGNSYAIPEGPYHLWVLGDEVTLNGNPDTMYVPEEYRGCPDDSLWFNPTPDQYVRSAVTIDEETGVWDVELAIYNPNVNAQGKIGFNLGGSNGSEAAYNEYFDAYQYWTWQPHVPNDPWAAPAENDPGFYNLVSSSHWAILYFEPGEEDILRETLDVPMADSGAVVIDGVMDENAWEEAAEVNLITNTGYNIWANKYYRESLVEPEFDELYGRLLWSDNTLYVFMHIDEFVNDSTGLYFNGQWAADQLFISLSSRLGLEMMGWYDGNSYAIPQGPYHLWVLGDEVTLNDNPDTLYVPEEYRLCPSDSLRFNVSPDEYVQSAVVLNEETGLWDVELAIYNPHITDQSSIAFNVGGSNGSEAAYNEYFDAYQYWTWQPNIPNDPWAAPAEADPGFYNLANSSRWAMLNFKSTISSVGGEGNTDELVNQYQLLQNYPNPFNPSTTIKFRVPETGKVSLRVYNILGQLVATLVDNQVVGVGEHTINWNASNLSSGIYFYELRAENNVQTKKMMLLK